MKLIINNIKELVGVEIQPKHLLKGREMSSLGTIEDAFVLVDNGLIVDFGSVESVAYKSYLDSKNFEVIDAEGGHVFPSFCDSHTHLVYPASREIEYIDKIKGLSYEEIAKRGGGILNSAHRMQVVSEEDLFESAWHRLEEIADFGTGAVEIKSGYGLTTESELKMLRVIRKLKEKSALSIKATFLGAHAVPMEYRGRQQDYVDLIINEMIPMVATEELADFIDVFCDKGFLQLKILIASLMLV
jgi:imidazolonepropionase